MKKNRIFLLILLSLSACVPTYWDTSNYTKYKVSMEYDYGDVVYTSVCSCKTTPDLMSNGYFNFHEFVPSYFDASVGYKFQIEACNTDNDGFGIWGQLSQDNKFEFNHMYYADFKPTFIETTYINKDGVAFSGIINRISLNKLWYIFLPPSDDEFAFSLQFGGESLDRSSLPDSVYVNVKGQIDIYKEYFKDKGYIKRWGNYTEYIH